MKNTISSIIFKHGEDDYSIWFPDFSGKEMKRIVATLEEFTNEGYSIRGTKEDLIEEFKNMI